MTDRQTRTRPEQATLLDVLIDGFEKNESMYGHHWRSLPLVDEAAAIQKFTQLVTEARTWKGAPLDERNEGPRRLARWPDLQIRQLGRAIMVLVRAARFSDWWHASETWGDDPFGPIYEWLDEERPG